MTTSLTVAIVRTVAYFHYFDYPVTVFEIWKWLLEPDDTVSLADVMSELETSTLLQRRLQRHGAYYGLGNVAQQVAQRHTRFLDATRKYRKAERTARFLGRLPWVRGIAVCNSLAWRHTTPESDIDLFIVAAAGRVWSARFLSTVPAMLLKQRPGESLQDPVCLSFFVTPEALAFEQLKISSEDSYLAYWCRSLVPLVDHSGWQERFEAENVWLGKVLPNAAPVKMAYRFRFRPRLRLLWVPFSEKLFRALQVERFPTRIRELMNKDTRVIVSDDMLKFHENDRREDIAQSLQRTVKAILEAV